MVGRIGADYCGSVADAPRACQERQDRGRGATGKRRNKDRREKGAIELLYRKTKNLGDLLVWRGHCRISICSREATSSSGGAHLGHGSDLLVIRRRRSLGAV